MIGLGSINLRNRFRRFIRSDVQTASHPLAKIFNRSCADLLRIKLKPGWSVEKKCRSVGGELREKHFVDLNHSGCKLT